jgi:sugar phosphate isomerase/epimerase
MAGLLDRRDFLKTSGALAAASLASQAAPRERADQAQNATRPRLLPACCAYSYGSYLRDGKMTMEDFIVKAVELGVLGVEITTYWLKSTDPAYLATLRKLAHQQGTPVSGASIGTQMCERDPAKRQEIVQTIQRWVDATDRLGGSHLRVFGDNLPAGSSEAQGIEWVAETMKAACEYAGKKGITLGIESHGGLTSAANIVAILRRVDSPYAGCTLDISNFRENPYEQIEMCLPYATNAHIRDWWGERRTPLDLDRVWQLFAKHGYKGYLCAEYEGQEDPMTAVPKLIGTMKTLCRKYSTA